MNRAYAHSHEQILDAFGACCIPHHEPISGVFGPVLGDLGYLIRSPDLDQVIEIAHYIQQLA